MRCARLRLFILCEDPLHQRFMERLCDRWGIGPRQRMLDASPPSKGSAAQYVIDHFVQFVEKVRSARRDPNVGGLVVVDGDEKGLHERRRQLALVLKDAGLPPLDPEDPRFAIVIPCWHLETWVAWLCGHRPVDEGTRYKAADEHGREVGRLIERGDYSARMAADRWIPPASDEQEHLPSLTAARRELRRLDLSA